MAQRLFHLMKGLRTPSMPPSLPQSAPIVSTVILAAVIASGCSPRVEVAVPQEPITINLNVKIEHEILVKVDKEIDEIFDENSDLF